MVYCGSRICGRTLTVIAMAYAIFKTGGKQYRVQTGDVIDVECINTLEEGAEASFDQVLMVENDGKVTVGTPMVEGATVSAKVVSQFRGKKIIAFKFKRRKALSLRKLEEEQSNLVRVNDILGELEKQFGPLQKQSETAKEYL